jgi:hypothetical protein
MIGFGVACAMRERVVCAKEPQDVVHSFSGRVACQLLKLMRACAGSNCAAKVRFCLLYQSVIAP